jgi:hypothetical protein
MILNPLEGILRYIVLDTYFEGDKRMNNCELVKKAYVLYLEEDRKKELENGKGLKVPGDEYTESVGRAIDEFIHNRNMSLLLDDKNNFLYSNGKHWAAINPGQMARRNFKLFLEDNQTKSIIRSLVTNDFTNNQNKDIIRSYFEFRDCFPYLAQVMRPWAYTNRLFTILVRDLTTTISNENVLIKVANALGIFTQGKTYGEVQLDVRLETDNCLKELGLYDDCSTFDKAVIAWYVHKVLDDVLVKQ